MKLNHQAILEEILSLAGVCAGALMYQAGFTGWAIALWIKAGVDMVCALYYWAKNDMEKRQHE